MQALPSKKNYFVDLNNFMTDPSAGDVLDEWLLSPPLGMVTDPIAWWTAMESAGHPLSRMALNFMSALDMYCTLLHMFYNTQVVL